MRSEDHDEVLSAQDVCFSYGSFRAIDHVDLGLGPGVHGLLGVNGAGKTTLLRMAGTLAKPSQGRFRVHGSDVSSHRGRVDARAALGFLPQHASWPGHFTVSEFVTYFAWLRRVPRKERQTAAELAIEAVGLQDQASAKLSTLSGGQHRRAMLLQALVHRPKLLILDEPTAGLDPIQRVRVRDLLQSLAGGCSVIVSTHLVEDVATVADSITVLDAGRVVFHGPPDALAGLQEPGLPGATPFERGFHSLISGRDGG